jgi:hypothetical protein
MTETVKAALRALQRGFQPVSIPLGTKGPKTPDWHRIRYTSDKIPYAFTGKNIGLLLGAPSGGLVDVDLDCSEAVLVADAFLPVTEMEAGRPTRPRSHRFYRDSAPPPKAEQFRDPRDGKMLVELRSSDGTKGVQTVIPPSVHPEGEPYVWDKDGEPVPIPSEGSESTWSFYGRRVLRRESRCCCQGSSDQRRIATEELSQRP